MDLTTWVFREASRSDSMGRSLFTFLSRSPTLRTRVTLSTVFAAVATTTMLALAPTVAAAQPVSQGTACTEEEKGQTRLSKNNKLLECRAGLLGALKWRIVVGAEEPTDEEPPTGEDPTEEEPPAEEPTDEEPSEEEPPAEEPSEPAAGDDSPADQPGAAPADGVGGGSADDSGEESADELPLTGVKTTVAAGLAVLLLAGGAGAVVIARKRRVRFTA